MGVDANGKGGVSGSCVCGAAAAVHSRTVRLSARVDYAVRAALELTAAEPETVTSERIAEAQEVPASFLINVLGDLRRTGLVRSERGAAGGGNSRPMHGDEDATSTASRPPASRRDG